ncbi:hypothetical protein [Microbacterium galbinum]|uniref:Uncharacterized protein n=1 Tax=Microbacterium galbinum TaxID=2851646 RepID=A0ABY4IRU7_9MICO|nr:hypothetical protein [Microbacterium galbinum]UPL14375.1 hypothetical protein KV396_07775 [Microbacterium galbinum]
MPHRDRKASRASLAKPRRRFTVALPPRGLWVEVERGFHVGNERGVFLGSVKAADPEPGYHAFGPTSEHIGWFDELEAAKVAVIAATGVGSLAR